MPGPLRIVFLSHVARFSGAEIEMLRFIEAARDVESIVILAENGPLIGPLQEAGAQVEIIPLAERARGLRRMEVRAGTRQVGAATDIARYVLMLRGSLARLRPDVISTISLKAGAYGTLAGRLSAIPVVFHLHDQISPNYLARQAVLPMRLMIGSVPSAVISPSRTTLETVGRFRRGVRTAIIPHPIPMPTTTVTIRDRVARIGIVGRIAPWKGQDVFLKAFARGVTDSDVRAVVVGSPIFGEEDFGRELKELAGRLGISDRVDFLGFRRDVHREFQDLDLLVHASVLTEPFGTVVFEAMAAGLPVIAARSGGVAEYVVHGQHGLLHTPGDDGDLARMLRLALDDRVLRTDLSAHGRELTRSFAPETIARRWIEIYNAVIGRSASAPATGCASRAEPDQRFAR
jgi:glycosyltransferase involved in cell wall biosynthesis